MPANGNYEYDCRSAVFRAFNPNVDRDYGKTQPKTTKHEPVETGLETVWNGTHYIQVKVKEAK